MILRVDIKSEKPNPVEWLEIETDELDTKGVFLYYNTDTECFDTWHKNLEDAYLSANEQYGITKDEWVTISI